MTPSTSSTSFTERLKKGWFDIVLSILAVIILILFFFLVYQRIMSNKPVAKLLPSDSTIGFLTLSIDENDAAFRELNGLFLQTGSGSLWQQYAGISDTEFERGIGPWIGNNMSIAFLQSDTKAQPVVFLSLQDEEKMRASILTAKNVVQQYQGVDLYFFEKKSFTGFAMVLENNLILSTDDAFLFSIIDVQQGRRSPLYGMEHYVEISKNLPSRPFIAYYVDYPKSVSFLKQTWDFRKEYRDILQLFSPLEKDVFAIGGAVERRSSSQQQAEWYGKTVLVGAKGMFSPVAALMPTTGHTSVPGNTLFYIHVPQLFSAVSSFLSSIGSTSIESEIIIEGLINWWLQRNVASSLSFNDVARLLTGESTIMQIPLSGTDILGWLAVFPVRSEQEAEQKLASWFTDFQETSEWFYTPKIRDLVLPDETVGKEVYLDPKEIAVQEEPFHNALLHSIAITGDTLSPGYIVLDGNVYIFTHKALLQELIDGSVPPVVFPLGRGTIQGLVTFDTLQTLMDADEEGLPRDWYTLLAGRLILSLTFFDQGVILEQLVSPSL